MPVRAPRGQAARAALPRGRPGPPAPGLDATCQRRSGFVPFFRFSCPLGRADGHGLPGRMTGPRARRRQEHRELGRTVAFRAQPARRDIAGNVFFPFLRPRSYTMTSFSFAGWLNANRARSLLSRRRLSPGAAPARAAVPATPGSAGGTEPAQHPDGHQPQRHGRERGRVAARRDPRLQQRGHHRVRAAGCTAPSR